MAVKARFRRNFLSLQRPQSLSPDIPIDKSIKPSQIYVNRLEPLVLESEGRRGDSEVRARNAKTPSLAPRRVVFKMSGHYGSDPYSEVESSLFSFPAARNKLKLVRSASSEKRLGMECPRCKESRASLEGVPAQLIASHALATPDIKLIRPPSLRPSPCDSRPNLPTPTRNLSAEPSPFSPTKRSFSPFTLRDQSSIRNDSLLFAGLPTKLTRRTEEHNRRRACDQSTRVAYSRVSMGEIHDLLFAGREKTHHRR